MNNEIELNTEITEELRLEKLSRDMIRNIQSARKEAGLSVENTVIASYPQSEDLDEVVERFGDEIMEKVGAISLKPHNKYEVKKL